jgi:hypothetical protein
MNNKQVRIKRKQAKLNKAGINQKEIKSYLAIFGVKKSCNNINHCNKKGCCNEKRQ